MTVPPSPPAQHFWPYNFEEAETRLNLDQIRQQGRFFLKRALNIERMVAFVGVGASMAYGRVSWGELALVQIDIMDRFFSKDRLAGRGELEDLVNQLRQIRGTMDDPDVITLSMQITEQIWDLCPLDIKEQLAKKFGIGTETLANKFGIGKEPLANKFDIDRIRKTGSDLTRGSALFREVIKRETVSVLPHMLSIISNKFNNSLDDQLDCEARRLRHIDLISSRDDLAQANWIDDHTRRIDDHTRRFASLFSKSMIVAAGDSAKLLKKELDKLSHDKPSRPELAIIYDYLKKIIKQTGFSLPSKDPTQLLPPYRYFYVGLILATLRAIQSYPNVINSFLCNCHTDGAMSEFTA